MPKLQYDLEVVLAELKINKHPAGHYGKYSLQLFYGSARHQTEEFECGESRTLQRRVRLSSLVNDSLEVWLMQEDHILAYAHTPVPDSPQDIELPLALDNEEFAQLALSLNCAVASIEKQVIQDPDEDLLKGDSREEQSEKKDESSKKAIEDSDSKLVKTTCLVTITNATLTD
jgi:hypothetical protein